MFWRIQILTLNLQLTNVQFKLLSRSLLAEFLWLHSVCIAASWIIHINRQSYSQHLLLCKSCPPGLRLSENFSKLFLFVCAVQARAESGLQSSCLCVAPVSLHNSTENNPHWYTHWTLSTHRLQRSCSMNRMAAFEEQNHSSKCAHTDQSFSIGEVLTVTLYNKFPKLSVVEKRGLANSKRRSTLSILWVTFVSL